MHFLCSVPYCFRTSFLHGIRVRFENLYNRLCLKGEPRGKENRWTEEWLARFRRRSSTKTTTCLGPTRCTSTYSGTVTGVISKEQMIQHPVMKTDTSPYKDLNPQPLGRRVTPLTIRVTHVIYNHNNYITSYHKIFRVFSNMLEYSRRF